VPTPRHHKQSIGNGISSTWSVWHTERQVCRTPPKVTAASSANPTPRRTRRNEVISRDALGAATDVLLEFVTRPA
jgi:hypothetical protein